MTSTVNEKIVVEDKEESGSVQMKGFQRGEGSYSLKGGCVKKKVVSLEGKERTKRIRASDFLEGLATDKETPTVQSGGFDREGTVNYSHPM